MDNIVDSGGNIAPSRNTFPALHAPMQRDSFYMRLTNAWPMFGVEKGALNSLSAMMDHTAPRDWTSTETEPCCYATQVVLAKSRGISVRTFRRHERALVRAGLIEKRVRANGSRSGYVGCGIFFSPLIALQDEIADYIDRQKEESRETDELCNKCSLHKRGMIAGLVKLREIAPDHPQLDEFEHRWQDWPKSDRLREMSLSALRTHEQKIETLVATVHQAVDERTLDPWRPDMNVRSYIQDSNEDLIEPCNPSRDRDGLEMSQMAGDEAGSETAASLATDGKAGETGPSGNVETLKSMTPERLYALASDEMRMHLDLARGPRSRISWQDLEMATFTRRQEIPIGIGVWEDAQNRLGPASTALCVFLIDARRSDPEIPIRNPGGYLKGMVRAHEKGKLNLMGSLIGLSERRRAASAGHSKA